MSEHNIPTNSEKLQMPKCESCGSTKHTMIYVDGIGQVCEHCLREVGIETIKNNPDKYKSEGKRKLHG